MLDNALYFLCEALPARLPLNLTHLCVILPLVIPAAFLWLAAKGVSK